MLKEYYHNGKIAFHLGLEPNGKPNGWNIIATFPPEVLQSNNDKIASFTAFSQATSLCKEKYLNGVAEIVISDSSSHSFFYPSYIFENSSKVQSEIFDFIFAHINEGFVLSIGDFFSETFKQTRHFILRQKYFQIRRFYKEANYKFRPCSRAEFQSSLKSIEASREYVEYMNSKNHFCVFADDEDDYVLYFLLRYETPVMIVISERI